MAFGGMVLLIGPALVVEIVQQRGEAPKLLVGGGLAGVSAHASFDGERVLAQIFVGGVFAEQGPAASRVIMVWEWRGLVVFSA